MIALRALHERGLGVELVGDGEVQVRGVRHDSRAVEPGDLFVAISGQQADGARFAASAVERGAVAVAAETTLALPAEVPQLRVENARVALGALAAAVYGDPTAELSVVGLTGTNGKTTTAWLVDEALGALGQRPALLGTVESRGPGLREPAPFTTPEGDALARFARKVVDAGATHLVMEVSSHALGMHRADAVHFAVAAFTNLTQDHLDYHGTMEAYFAAKARLFTALSPGASVINVDDPHGAQLADEVPGCLRVSREGDGDVAVRTWTMDRDGMRATVTALGEEVELRSVLIGAHNLDNLLLALGVLVALGFEADEAAKALGAAKGAPGRLERVDGLEDVRILVDYAHTPDALSRALAALRPITPGRLFAVFGCGGDRDAAKRPQMGRAVARGADLAVITSDNPRTEDPMAILAAIEPGVSGEGWDACDDLVAFARADRGLYRVEEDRRAAIREAVSVARPGDTILIAGKGHEDYQIRGTTKIHFDDREEARAAIAGRSQ